MRRSLAALAATVAVLWLTLSYKTAPLPRRSTALSAVASTSASTQPTTTTTAAAAPPLPRSATSRVTTTTVVTPRTAPPTTAAVERTVLGSDYPNKFGDVQVELVYQGTRIVDVKAVQLPYEHPRSQYISDQAAPQLRYEVLQAQSARIDSVSGATYTSQSYAESVQSAIDRANAGA